MALVSDLSRHPSMRQKDTFLKVIESAGTVQKSSVFFTTSLSHAVGWSAGGGAAYVSGAMTPLSFRGESLASFGGDGGTAAGGLSRPRARYAPFFFPTRTQCDKVIPGWACAKRTIFGA